MINNMFIPKKIKVGFRKRDHTYTKLLAYVIYFDEKGKLRKEKSWEGWRDKSISPVEYDNSPISGFVLNKSVGGYSYRWGDFRQSYVRVYDPRGFEFEITIPNLLYILEYTSSIKGKGLEGEFIYAWDGTYLERHNVEDIAKSFGVDVVPIIIGGGYARRRNCIRANSPKVHFWHSQHGRTCCTS